ncbi:GUN4 domain-containing protein [Lyngbya sp. CCY1209]|uniref:GUN4 domain-containing protein n=1 Tax=Lyngbya sp. CCY1209 TaxID=2886103 RepID=UPI002D202061|nr:GUN4 domain-containing protein [Lyngbya sp. CCY1209]MEB3885616.1 GUN4 domain-containing protein [Lyngbya sp. CCY1209]
MSPSPPSDAALKGDGTVKEKGTAWAVAGVFVALTAVAGCGRLLNEGGGRSPSAETESYATLDGLLAAGEWEQAQDETARLMVETAGRAEAGYLVSADIEAFPCEDLRAIDGLWAKHSGNRFGFAAQTDAYRRAGGTADGSLDEEQWEQFAGDVGWRDGKRWASLSGWGMAPDDLFPLTFDIAAPPGHLPVIRTEEVWATSLFHTVMREDISTLARRAIACGLSGR